MNLWEKLITDPELGPRSGSPLVRAVFGLGLLFFECHTLFTGAIQINRHDPRVYIHFSDHPKTFVLTCIAVGIGALWALSSARKRYLMHDE